MWISISSISYYNEEKLERLKTLFLPWDIDEDASIQECNEIKKVIEPQYRAPIDIGIVTEIAEIMGQLKLI